MSAASFILMFVFLVSAGALNASLTPPSQALRVVMRVASWTCFVLAVLHTAAALYLMLPVVTPREWWY